MYFMFVFVAAAAAIPVSTLNNTSDWLDERDIVNLDAISDEFRGIYWDTAVTTCSVRLYLKLTLPKLSCLSFLNNLGVEVILPVCIE